MELNKAQSEALSKTLLDIVKLIAGIFVLGTLVTTDIDPMAKIIVAIIGTIFCIMLIIWALILLKDKEKL